MSPTNAFTDYDMKISSHWDGSRTERLRSESHNSHKDFFAPFTSAQRVPPSETTWTYRPTGAYGVLAQRQPARGARFREVPHVAQPERVWRPRQRRHGPDSKRGAGDGSLQGNRQHTPPAGRSALGCGSAQGWWGALDREPEQGTEELLALVAPAAPDFCSEDY